MLTFRYPKIAKVLVRKGLLGKEQLEEVLRLQREEGASIGKLLVEKGLISEDTLLSCLAEELNLPPVDLSKFTIDPELVELIPEHVARHYLLIPVAKFSNILTVAMADPLNVFALDDLRMTTGYTIQPVLASEDAIRQAIEEYYGKEDEEDLWEEGGEDEDIGVVEEEEEDGAVVIGDEEDKALFVRLVDMILAEGIRRGASDIHIEPYEKELRVRYRVDGVLEEGFSPPKRFQSGITARLKIMADLDISERRIPQDGRFKVRYKGREIDYRVSILPVAHGEKIVMRVLDKSALKLDLRELGFDEQTLEHIRKTIYRPYGMMLVTGPTGSGKSTTLYSVLKELNSPERNIITVEDPVEYQLEGITQIQINHEIGLTFASALRAILRQDPDVIMVGEIRDFETADIAVKAALTGHLVFSTLHTNDAPGAITRLVSMGVEPFLVGSSVSLVLAQRLVRKICPDCKEEYPVPANVRERYGIKRETLFKGRGCNACRGTGYKGRCAVVEVLPISQNISDLIMRNASEGEIKRAAREEGFVTLGEYAMRKVEEGVTTLEEVLRVTSHI